MKKSGYKAGQKFGKWTLISRLGGGGNGEVWNCIDDDDNPGAIKLLRAIRPKSYARFLDETTIMDKNADVVGIMPMLDKNLPEDPTESTPFYVMPVAKNAENALKGKSIEDKIAAMLQVAETLRNLHEREISHRDIKPPNLLLLAERYCLADFGLVDYPDKKDVSDRNEEIGAKWTIAPEMRRDSSAADGLKADVYSFAKTLWIILTENPKGFDGQYSTESILELRKFYKETYTTPIDKLLAACTSNDPNSRPDIDEVISMLKNWQTLNQDFHERNLEQWFEVQQKLFPTSFPTRVIWENRDDIIKVMKVLCSYSDLNHMFFPTGGGLDLEDARVSNEEDCIELDFQSISVVKAKRLVFESFGYDPEWNYFRLELEELEPSGVYDKLRGEEEFDDEESRGGEKKIVPENQGKSGKDKRSQEYLSELFPGYYDKYDLVEHRSEYRDVGYEIPEEARHVTRWLNGNFVIFNKRSPYNLTNSTYDGRHNKMSTDEFRDYIQKNVDAQIERKSRKSIFERILDKRRPRTDDGHLRDLIRDV